jgi:ubiquinone/menaquinone biosynthesis C-methylase UbiE
MTKEYNPREYWPARLQREGALYVSTRNNKKVNDRQGKVFEEALLLSMLGTSPGHILDFGCGVGRFAETVLEEADRYTGVDINGAAFEYAPYLDLADFVPLPEDKIPFEDGTFDSAMSLTVLQHIVDPEQFELWTGEISRVVKPGGYFYIIDDANQKAKMGIHMKVRGPEKIAEALGAKVDFDLGLISAERPNSHYCFRAEKV